MHPIIYDVAVSLDGYICGPGGEISAFAHTGAVVDDYRARLSTYAVAIMGRATYEVGYAYGLKPGDNPYPWMAVRVYSDTLDLPAGSAVTVVRSGDLTDPREGAGGPVYLCGGGAFAGSLLARGMIDRLRLKRAPILLGGGVRLFGEGGAAPVLTCLDTKTHADGYVYQEFAVA